MENFKSNPSSSVLFSLHLGQRFRFLSFPIHFQYLYRDILPLSICQSCYHYTCGSKYVYNYYDFIFYFSDCISVFAVKIIYFHFSSPYVDLYNNYITLSKMKRMKSIFKIYYKNKQLCPMTI